MTKAIAIALAFVATAGVTSAKAENYSFIFTSGAGSAYNVYGNAQTTADGDAQLITSLTGTYDAQSIQLLAPGAEQTDQNTINDSLIYPDKDGTGALGPQSTATGYLDGGGIAFSVGGTNYDLFFRGDGGTYILYHAGAAVAPGGSFSLTDLGPSSISAAPEPASWALMMLGVGAIGAMLGYRKRVLVDHEAKLATIG